MKNCPECSSKIDEQAEVCPECGCPLVLRQTTAPSGKPASKLMRIVSIICLVIGIFIFGSCKPLFDGSLIQ